MTLTVVRPRYLWVPEATGTYGAEAADLAELYGRPLDPEQRLAVDAAMSHDASGNWAALETCRVEPRQNGKTSGELTAIVFTDLFLFDADKISWTAHLFKTTREAFDDHKALIAGCPELSRRVKKITEANGEEAIELHGGAKLQYLARSKGGGRGLGGKRVVMDEALFLTTGMIGALMPTLSARPNPQISYASSSGLLESSQLRSLRDRGRPGGDPSLVYVEHCADDPECGDECPHKPGTPGCSFDDEARWRQANHAIERGRIGIEYVAAERRAMATDPAEFGRERLGYWQDPVAGAADMDMAAWAGRADAKAAPVDPVKVAVDCAPAGTSAAIVVCGSDARDVADSAAVLEVIRHERRNRWVVDTLVSMREELGEFSPVLDPAGSAGALIPDLEAAGFDLDLLSGREAAQSCAAFTTGVSEGRLWHRDEQSLNTAVAGVRLRPVGDAFRFSRRDSTVDISPAVAAASAFFRWLGETDTDYDPMESFL